MAGSLTIMFASGQRTCSGSLPLLSVLVTMMLVACDAPSTVGRKELALPEIETGTSVMTTDQTEIANNALVLADEGGGCRLEVAKLANQQVDKYWLKPMAPCYFMKSPGGRLQVFQQDKNTRVLAVVGTPLPSKDGAQRQRCGREVQGILVDHRGVISLSTHILSGSIYCAEQGLDNFQYSLFASP